MIVALVILYPFHEERALLKVAQYLNPSRKGIKPSLVITDILGMVFCDCVAVHFRKYHSRQQLMTVCQYLESLQYRVPGATRIHKILLPMKSWGGDCGMSVCGHVSTVFPLPSVSHLDALPFSQSIYVCETHSSFPLLSFLSFQSPKISV